MYEETNNDLQNTTQKTKYRARKNPQKQEVNLGAQEGYLVPAPLVAAFVLLLEVLEVVNVNMSK